jgi:hypothetical protein
MPKRQYAALGKASDTLHSALTRVSQMVLENPALMTRIELLPAEKMLAAIGQGRNHFAVTSSLVGQMNGKGIAQFLDMKANGAGQVAYADALEEVFLETAPVKQLKKKYKLTRLPQGMKQLQHSLLASYKKDREGAKKFPRIAIVEFRTGASGGSGFELLAEHMRRAGYPTEVVAPEHLEYRNGVLCRGEFGIEIVYRNISAQEFLFRFDLQHPLVRAYRDGAVCMVNEFRAEILQKKAILDLLTDESITGKFPAAERRAIKDHVPWTRLVKPGMTRFKKKTVDLQEFILANKDKLTLRPNDVSTDLHSFRGWELEGHAWERALTTALRSPYVVQERVKPVQSEFPVYQFGAMQTKLMNVQLSSHWMMGEFERASATVSDATSSFSLLSGVAPVYLIESGR